MSGDHLKSERSKSGPTPKTKTAILQEGTVPSGGAGTGKPSSSRKTVILAAAALLALGIGVAKFSSDSPSVGITTTTAAGDPFGAAAFMASDDQVTEKQWKERAAAFATFKTKGAAHLDRVDPAQAKNFVQTAVAAPEKRQQLQKSIQDNSVDMVAVGFYDDCAEDGDVVRIHSGDVDTTISLVHQVQYVLIPVPKGGTAEVYIEGIHDGTGGITLGMVTPAGTVHMPPMQPGLQVSFTAR